jgi:uncharacterized protein (DUF1778 family)
MMYIRAPRTAVISVRSTESDRELLRLAAQLTQTSLSSYIAQKAVRAALSDLGASQAAESADDIGAAESRLRVMQSEREL